MKDSTQLAIIVGGAAVVAYVLYRAVPKVAAAATAVGNAVNPLNNENVFATSVNKVGGILAGDTSGSWSLGSWIYDLTHADPLASSPAASIDRYTRPPSTSSGSYAYDETDRLLARYPAPTAPAEDRYDAMGNYLGAW